MHPDIYGESFNIGSGQDDDRRTRRRDARPVRDPDEPEFGTMEGRGWDLADWYADPHKALDMLGWQPEIALEEGLRPTADWVEIVVGRRHGRADQEGPGARKRSVSAIIACYKDEPAIPIMYERLTRSVRQAGHRLRDHLRQRLQPGRQRRRDPGLSAATRTWSASRIRATSARKWHFAAAWSCPPRTRRAARRRSAGSARTDRAVLRASGRGYDVVYGRRVRREMPWLWGRCTRLLPDLRGFQLRPDSARRR